MKKWTALAAVAGLAAAGCSTKKPNVYAYPLKGQTAEQVSRDQAECEAWAAQQTGVQPGTGAAVGAAAGGVTGTAVGAAKGETGDRDAYNSAFATCMSARGYQVGAHIEERIVVPRPVATPVVVAPPPAMTVVYPHGRYELHGNGVTIPYQWVWVPAPPAPPSPPASPASPASPPPPPPATSSAPPPPPVPPGPPSSTVPAPPSR